MRRDLSALAGRELDVVIVGGGIFGICTAWEAASRGLSVALVERGDFTEGASANCFKIVHSGIRYLQQVDIARLRDSSRECNVLRRIAPHQITILPIVVPTHGYGLRGRVVLATGMQLFDLLAGDRNRDVRDAALRMPRGRLIGRRDVENLFPQLESRHLSGGGIHYEAQMHSPARLALCFLHSATQAGAAAANYAQVVRFMQKDARVVGVEVTDRLTGDTFEVRGRVTVNAAGGWAPHLHHTTFGAELSPTVPFSRDLCLVLDRSFNDSHALAVLTRTADPDAIISRSRRHLFLAPWCGRTLLGVWHSLIREHPDRSRVSEAEVQACLDEANQACPGLDSSLDQVTRVQSGPVLLDESSRERVHFGARSRLIDHDADGIGGLLTLVGVRYTMARHAAERAVDLLFRKLGRSPVPSQTAKTPVFGGDVGDVITYRREALAATSPELSAETIAALVRRYGSEHRRVLAYAEGDRQLAHCMENTNVTGAEVVHAVREEMALTLADIVLRRTELATAGSPGTETLRQTAAVAAPLLGWDNSRTATEVESVRRTCRGFGFADTGLSDGVPRS